MTENHHFRSLERIHAGRETQDGAGVRLTRIIGQSLHRRLDPFLMLDHFKSDDPEDYIKGFPEHPHRGFETLTLLQHGRMRHRDSRGNEGVISSGGAQWMMAGRGIIHSEMPEQEKGRLEGYQLWINLPSEQKLAEPDYLDLEETEIPEIVLNEARIRVIAGWIGDCSGPLQRPVTLPLVVDIRMPKGTEVDIPIPKGHHAALVPSQGALWVDGQTLPNCHLGILGNLGDTLRIQAQQHARILLIAGKPLEEDIAAYGPFVMNTEREIQDAISDYQSGKFA